MKKEKNSTEKADQSEKNVVKHETRDKLISEVYKMINESESDYFATFLDEEESTSTIIDWVSTGDPILDIHISNRMNGGIAVGRISEINGLESCVTEDTLIDIIVE